MITTLKKAYQKESFNPSLLSLCINPLFFVRRGLYRGVKANATYMHGRMLDFGCGSKPYKSLFHVQEYVGLDIEKSGHNHANEPIDVFYDGSTIPFEDAYFDTAFSSEVFEHVANLDEILDELYRVMKPGGVLLLTLPFLWEEHETPYDFSRYTSFGGRRMLESKGFQILKLEKSTTYVETVFQLWTVYISQYLLPTNPYIKLLLMPFAIAPVNLLGLLLSTLLPNPQSLYHSNIIVAQKIP